MTGQEFGNTDGDQALQNMLQGPEAITGIAGTCIAEADKAFKQHQDFVDPDAMLFLRAPGGKTLCITRTIEHAEGTKFVPLVELEDQELPDAEVVVSGVQALVGRMRYGQEQDGEDYAETPIAITKYVLEYDTDEGEVMEVTIATGPNRASAPVAIATRTGFDNETARLDDDVSLEAAIREATYAIRDGSPLSPDDVLEYVQREACRYINGQEAMDVQYAIARLIDLSDIGNKEAVAKSHHFEVFNPKFTGQWSVQTIKIEETSGGIVPETANAVGRAVRSRVTFSGRQPVVLGGNPLNGQLCLEIEGVYDPNNELIAAQVAYVETPFLELYVEPLERQEISAALSEQIDPGNVVAFS